MRRLILVTAVMSLAFGVLPPTGSATDAKVPHVLVFHGTFGFRHPVIEHSNDILQQLADSTGAFTVEFTINPADITRAKLEGTDILFFNSTTGKPPFTEQQRADMLQWLSCGGGWIGVHAAADSNYGWEEHAELLGAQFDSHPHGEGGDKVRMILEHKRHPANRIWKKKFGAKGSFRFGDELYRWRATPRRIPGVKVMYSLDEKTETKEIQKGLTPYEHHQPLAWTKSFRGRDRVYYTNLGHGNKSWDWPVFQKSMVDAIKWVGQKRPDLECFGGEPNIPPTPLKPPTRTEPATDECTVPNQPVRPGPTWQTSGEAKRLTEDGDAMEMPGPGVPGGLGWSEQTYVVDLSGSGSPTAKVTFDLSWASPSDDYDLSVTAPWGWAGSDAIAGNSEQVVLENVPHCSVLMVYGENLYASSQQPPSLTATVEPGS